MQLPKHFKNKSFKIELEAGTYKFCACGLSNDGIFCDMSHKQTKLKPIKFSVETQKVVALCMCKQSKSLPFCDGTHRKLA